VEFLLKIALAAAVEPPPGIATNVSEMHCTDASRSAYLWVSDTSQGRRISLLHVMIIEVLESANRKV
jgi:hypothetical protein